MLVIVKMRKNSQSNTLEMANFRAKQSEIWSRMY